jgi:ABC-2 type transport system permease protein
MDIALDMGEAELQYYLRIAQVVTTHEDYRTNLVWDTTMLYEKFIYEKAGTIDRDVLIEALNYRRGVNTETFDDTYINITPQERQTEIDKADDYLNRLYDVIENNNFEEYIAISIEQQQTQIASYEEQIEIQEQTIIEHPDQEEELNRYMEDLKKQINLIKTNNIPLLEYRLEKHIVPGEDIWQNIALSEIEQANNNLQYTTILSEEDYNKEPYLAQQYKTYARYKAAIQAEIDEYNNQILVAQNSLDADKPDMKFVPTGARNQTYNFLYYSVYVALFAVVLGGWLMASEFQLGTIRLLMIRPKTRTKILMSKFTAALVICFGIYIAGTILNIITNGICFGFSDYAFPNYTASGEIGFFAYYIPKFIACAVTIVFGYCVAFMLSTVAKHMAVSISVPIVCFVGSIIGLSMLAWTEAAQWIAWTPLPYVQISQFFTEYSAVQQMMRNGAPVSLGYGIGLLMGLSVICTFISIWVFRKRDITN